MGVIELEIFVIKCANNCIELASGGSVQCNRYYSTCEVVEAKKQLAQISWGEVIVWLFIMQVVKKIQLISSGNIE